MAAAAAVDDSTICASSRHTRHHRTRVSGVGTTCAKRAPRSTQLTATVLEPQNAGCGRTEACAVGYRTERSALEAAGRFVLASAVFVLGSAHHRQRE